MSLSQMLGVLFWASSNLRLALHLPRNLQGSREIKSVVTPYSLKTLEPRRGFTGSLAAVSVLNLAESGFCQTPPVESSTLTIAIPLVLFFELGVLYMSQLLALTGLFPHLVSTSIVVRLLDSASLFQALSLSRSLTPLCLPVLWHLLEALTVDSPVQKIPHLSSSTIHAERSQTKCPGHCWRSQE